MKLEEITIEKVREAYEKTGREPANGGRRWEVGKACALEALAIAQGGDRQAWSTLLSDPAELQGFWHGFDKLKTPAIGLAYYEARDPGFTLRFEKAAVVGRAIAEELEL